MVVVISTLPLENAEKIGKFYVKGKYYSEKFSFLFFKGELYPKNIPKKELFKIISKNPKKVVDLQGEFFIIHYDSKSKKLSCIADKFGRETLYYYNNQKEFIISDDFWEIANAINAGLEDVEVQAVKEDVIFYGPLNYKTLLKKISFLPASTIAQFSLKTKKLALNQYWDMVYTPTKMTYEQASQKLVGLFDDSMKQIKDKAGDVTFGLGLSGGLDSRLVSHYAKKYNMNVRSFIIGDKRPRGTFISRDHASSKQLAKIFGFPQQDIQFDADSYESKMYYDIRNYPCQPSQIFITIHDSLPRFDHLLTGMYGGELFGSEIKGGVDNLSKSELISFMIKRWSYMPFSRGTLLGKFFSLFGKSTRKLILRKEIPGIITRNEYDSTVDSLKKFIEENSEKSNFNIFQKFIYFNSIGKNKYGYFSSMHGQKKSYASIFFNPETIMFSLNWPQEFFKDKKLQTYLYLNKFPQLCTVKAQNYLPSLIDQQKNSKTKKILAAADYYLRGGVSLQYSKWAIYNKKYQKFAKKVLRKPNPLFSKVFSAKKIKELPIEDGKIYENIIKVKYFLDVIQSKEYKNFVNEK